MGPGNPQTDSTVKRALRAIEELQAKIAALEGAGNEPIAVIGMGCRFPGGADNPASFWHLLKNGGDAVVPLPRERWNIDEYYDPDPDRPGKMTIRHGGFLEAIDGFDAPFFGISPREAACMDPQHRLALEVGWEALEQAGIAPGGLKGSRTGVFVGIGQNDYGRLKLGSGDPERIDAYDGTGNLFCFAAGRLSYVLGLQGPNMAIDTACSSSLVAIHQACLSLRAGDCSMALAGGVHLVVSPEVTIFLSRAHVLAPDGRCKTFDAAADGFGRGEGCGMIVLKRLSDALRDRDRILALIRGSAVNHDGAAGGLTVPNELAQQQLIVQALQNAGVDPLRVSYVEAHGTGTALGDPIEVSALNAALCKGRSADDPLIIGSVKTNLGHLEAAAGIAGVIKVILSLRHGTIPPQLHFRNPNPLIDWKALPIAVADRERRWRTVGGARIAGVSSFGFSGTNAHIVLEEVPEATAERRPGGPHVLTLSAKTDAALRSLARSFEEHLAAHPEQEIGDICFTVNTGRTPFNRRVAVIGETGEELRKGLAAYREDRVRPGLCRQGRGKDSAGSSLDAAESAPSAANESTDLMIRPGAGKHELTDDAASVADLARSFVNGEPIAWDDHYRGTGFRKVTLPTYPFQRQRQWVETGRKTSALRGKERDTWGRLPLPFSREVRFAGRFSETTPAHLTDHRLLDAVVVAAASQVSLVLAAATEALGTEAFRIERMVFPVPLIIPVRGARDVQLILEPVRDGEEAFAFRLASRPEVSGTDGAWTVHSSGEISRGPEKGCAASLPSYDREELQRRFDGMLTGDEFYAARRRSGYLFGPSFRRVERIWWGRDEALCSLTSSPASRGEGYPIDPGLLDSCFQMLGGFREDGGEKEHLLVPVRIARLDLIRTPPADGFWCAARCEKGVDGRTCSGSLCLTDEKGEGIVSVEGFELAPAPRALFRKEVPEEPGAARLEVRWRPVPAAAGRIEDPDPGAWLLLADVSGVAAELAAQIRARGERALLVTRETEYVRFDENCYGVNPDAADDFIRLLRGIAPPLRGVVCLWGIDLGRDLDDEALSRCETLCGNVAALVRALTGRQWGMPLWVVTEGAQAVGGGPTAPLQAALWGLSTVLEIEHPELAVRCVDLDPATAGARIPLLLEELLHADAENRIALRGNQRCAARLERLPERGGGSLRLAADASYLITGGLGGLGIEVARRMALRGARHLALCGRRAPTEQAAAKIGEIERTGCRVRVFATDVADRGAVRRLIDGIAADLPPLRGIVHAAGVLDDAILLRQDRSRFTKAMAPKVHGTLNLEEAAAERELDFFVCFSSASAVVGAAGQANYAAANACLDALMHLRRKAGKHGLSVNWGAWGDVGMAARMKDEARERVADQGMGWIAPEQGLDLMEELLGRDAVQTLAMVVDWERYLESRRKTPPLFANMVPRRSPAGEKVSGGWFQDVPENQRRARLSELVRSQVATTLGMASPEALEPRQRLFDLGLDSLMAVELKNRLEAALGMSLRSTLLFDYPTPEALVEHLAEEALSLSRAPRGGTPEPSGRPADVNSLLAEIEAMPEDALKARFAAGKGRR